MVPTRAQSMLKTRRGWGESYPLHVPEAADSATKELVPVFLHLRKIGLESLYHLGEFAEALGHVKLGAVGLHDRFRQKAFTLLPSRDLSSLGFQ